MTQTSAAPTVLLVEDERGVREFMSAVLEDAGCRVLDASSGPHALRIASSFNGAIDLLVTDICMPLMGGREVAEQLGAVRPGMKVLFVSGFFEDLILRRYAVSSKVALLNKPFTASQLEQRVTEVLDGGSIGPVGSEADAIASLLERAH